MTMKYIVALLPDTSDIFIHVANESFGAIAQDYMLSNVSLPHVTLAQFTTEHANLLADICNDIQTIVELPQIQFIGIGFTKKTETTWNASLTVARTSELIKLHQSILAILNKHSLKTISPSGDLYRPHLTLARITTTKSVILNFNEISLSNMNFKIVLGMGDAHGQFTKIIFPDLAVLDKHFL